MTIQLCLALDINVADTPLPLLYSDEPLLPFAREMIAATSDIVTAYKIDPSYFLAEGAAGMVALERIIRLIPSHTLTIWDARSTITNEVDAEILTKISRQYGVGAVTLAHNHNLITEQMFSATATCLAFYPAAAAHLTVIDRTGGITGRYRTIRGDSSWNTSSMVSVGHQILYASKRADFAEAAHLAALHWSAQLQIHDFQSAQN